MNVEQSTTSYVMAHYPPVWKIGVRMSSDHAAWIEEEVEAHRGQAMVEHVQYAGYYEMLEVVGVANANFFEGDGAMNGIERQGEARRPPIWVMDGNGTLRCPELEREQLLSQEEIGSGFRIIDREHEFVIRKTFPDLRESGISSRISLLSVLAKELDAIEELPVCEETLQRYAQTLDSLALTVQKLAEQLPEWLQTGKLSPWSALCNTAKLSGSHHAHHHKPAA